MAHALFLANMFGIVTVVFYACLKGGLPEKLAAANCVLGIAVEQVFSLTYGGLLNDEKFVVFSTLSNIGTCLGLTLIALRWPSGWICAALVFQSIQLYLDSSWMAQDESLKRLFIDMTNLIGLLWVISLASGVYLNSKAHHRSSFIKA